MGTKNQVKSNRAWAVVIGIGLMLSPIHNKWLTELVTRDGVVGFFLPSFGYAIVIGAPLVYILYKWEELDWGDWRVFTPLFIIVGAIGLSGLTADRWQGMISPFLMGLSLFALYLMARKLGKDIFLPLAIGAGVASFGIIIHGIVYPGIVTGGYVFDVSQGGSGTNYDVAVGYILLGVALYVKKHQWILAGLAIVAMFMSGSPEGVFVTVVLVIVVLFREDWGKRLIITLVPLTVIVLLYFGIGYGQELYKYMWSVATNEAAMSSIENGGGVSTIGYRVEIAQQATANIKPLGDGYNITAFTKNIVHNVPLIIVQQLGWPGIIAGLAWLWVSIWCLVKTRWKYVWVLILSLSVFDHFIWTQLGPFFWAIVGVSTAGGIESDLLFKRTSNSIVAERYQRIKETYNSMEVLNAENT